MNVRYPLLSALQLVGCMTPVKIQTECTSDRASDDAVLALPVEEKREPY